MALQEHKLQITEVSNELLHAKGISLHQWHP